MDVAIVMAFKSAECSLVVDAVCNCSFEGCIVLCVSMIRRSFLHLYFTYSWRPHTPP
jgi:hypothetical protein